MRTVSEVLVTDAKRDGQTEDDGLHIRRAFFFTSSSRPHNKQFYTPSQLLKNKYLAGLLVLPHNVQPIQSGQQI